MKRSEITSKDALQGLSRYRHVRELQAGSTAMVHLVEDRNSGKPCAIKLLDRSNCDLGTAREVNYQRSRHASTGTPQHPCWSLRSAATLHARALWRVADGGWTPCKPSQGGSAHFCSMLRTSHDVLHAHRLRTSGSA